MLEVVYFALNLWTVTLDCRAANLGYLVRGQNYYQYGGGAL